MNILIATDNPYNYIEVKDMVDALRKKHNVFVVAPYRESNGKAQAFSFYNRPLMISHRELVFGSGKSRQAVPVLRVYGTPADCVSFGLFYYKEQGIEIDLVVCGPNNGHNRGSMIHRGSTSALAREATFLGKKAVAICMPYMDALDFNEKGKKHIKFAIKFLTDNLKTIENLEFEKGAFLLINMPNVQEYKDIKGVKICKQCRHFANDTYEKHIDPVGKDYYWKQFSKARDLKENFVCNGDVRATFDGYISIVASTYLCCDEEMIEENGGRV